MSNTTDTPRKSGQRRRRRRGGKNRNNNPNRNKNSNQSGRQQGDKKGGSGKRRRPRRQPIPLSWWQKALIALGLYEDPNKRKGKAKGKGKKADKGAPKSNTRNARSKEREEKPKADSTRKRANKKPRKGGDPSTVQSSRVYVGNLSYDTTEEDLKELFKGVGNVRRVEIVYNRNTHRSKGYGFVEMINKDDAMRSVEVLHDQPFMGRYMTVSGAKNKDEQPDEDQEPTQEIKADDVELAPLPAETREEEAEPQDQPVKEAAAAAETPEEAALPEEQKPKQD
ncbi:MAG: RNA-binding protein [Akkermansiaceae bacterium]|nr:RNA-binding protein [Akkermansiaceae bacterium]